ncbi:alpha/beta hydrolase [Curtobacterium sp. RRHDQ10]|uniref:alpha/beta hydrolase n=1 Tax=Curtobacterium phyllosphaerae TaxID=3413379 RepID=UPI003BF3427B
MLHDLLRIPIVHPAVLVPVDVIAALLVIVTLLPDRNRPDRNRPDRNRRGGQLRRLLWRIGGIVVGAVVGVVLTWWIGDVQDAFGVSFTPVTRMWIAMLFGVAGLLVVALVQGRNGRRVVAVLATAAVALATGLGINVDFGAYRTIEQAITTDPYPAGSLGHEQGIGSAVLPVATTSTWTAPAGMPKHGRIISVRIPATVSHFHARRAVVYLPPAALTATPPVLPVVISLSGQPGQPSDMFATGRLGDVMNQYAAAHHGLAPIVVAPDQLGAPNRNPMCVDSRRLGRSATYIMTDTTNWIRSHLRVANGSGAWGIVGFSQGATCAMQFSTEHPGVFGAALAISSELAPVTGNASHSIAVAFHGSAAAYREAAPLTIMHEHAPYIDHLTVFAYGSQDAPYRASTTALRAGAIAAGMDTRLIVSPGSAHDWNTVRYAIVNGMPIVLDHLGLR